MDIVRLLHNAIPMRSEAVLLVFTLSRRGSAGIWILYTYVTFSGYIGYDTWSYQLLSSELCQTADFGTICSKLCLC